MFDCSRGLESRAILDHLFRLLSDSEQASFKQQFGDVSMSTAESLVAAVAAKGTYLLNFDSADGALVDFAFSSEVAKILEVLCTAKDKGVKVALTCRNDIKFPPICAKRKRQIFVEGLTGEPAIGMIPSPCFCRFFSFFFSFKLQLFIYLFIFLAEILRDNDPNNEAGLKNMNAEVLTSIVEKCQGIPKALEKVANILAEERTATVDMLLGSKFGAAVLDFLMQAEWKLLNDDQANVMMVLAVFNLPVPTSAISHLTSHFFPTIQLDSWYQPPYHLASVKPPLTFFFFVFCLFSFSLPCSLQSLIRRNLVKFNNREAYRLEPLDQQYAYNLIPKEKRTLPIIMEPDQPTSTAASTPAFYLFSAHDRAAHFYEKLQKPSSVSFFYFFFGCCCLF